ncbi:collagen alpha-1(XII) chain [Exaiptasia diaphana]|uniref:VWFA domain-containing protein n=1 Tax=Exaiptasia diaphana TaxID=2652724 RepID=A0A913XIP0_EXADI|nr:collagen alpha-1(XII) chain [Exaiptasia diaphana]
MWINTNYLILLQVTGSVFISCAIVCPVSIDMVFLLDGSSSIGSNDFIKLKDFIIKVVQYFRVSSQESRIGVVRYSDNASIELSFTDLQIISSIEKKIRNIPYLGGNTYTNTGLDKSLILFTANGRGHVHRVVIVINDGKSSKGEAAIQSAKKLKDNGIRILSLGFGTSFSLLELQQIATSADHAHTYPNAVSMLNSATSVGEAVCAASRGTQLYFTSISEKAFMINHVITNHHVTDDLECAFKCLTNKRCFSFNYFESTQMCQLNYSNKQSDPHAIIDDEKSIHYDMVFPLR